MPLNDNTVVIPYVSFKKSKTVTTYLHALRLNLRRRLGKWSPKQNPATKNCVFNVSYECGRAYTGETRRTLYALRVQARRITSKKEKPIN